jgi:uncharacterized protein (UPF0297 family)
MSNKFYKTFKPVLCVLRQQGYMLVIFIDDFVIIATSHVRCTLLVSLGFVIHVEKSIFFPLKKIIFLGFEINSITMKITLTSEKITKSTSRITELLEASRSTIRNVAQIIGYLVSSFPAVRYGECHYRAIERDKILELKIVRFKVLYWLPWGKTCEIYD